MNTNADEKRKEQIKKVESYRWVVWTILALMYIFVTFHRLGTGVVKADLQKTFNIGAAQFATIGSMYFYAYFIMQIPSGILADKLGPKKTVTLFSILAAIGSVTFGLSQTLTMAYVGRFIVGIGVSVVFICLIKIQSRWFYSKNFALMIGFVGLAANAGALLAQTPLVFATSTFGWRNTFVFMGVAMIIFSVLTLIFVKDDPTDMGLPGMDELEGRPSVKSDIRVGESLKSVMSNPKTWIVSIVNVGLYAGYIILLGTYGVSYLIAAYGLTLVQAANLIISAVVGSAAGSIAIGFASDKIKKRKFILIICSAATLAGWLIFVYVKLPVAVLAVFLFIFGFVMTSFTLTWTIANEVNDRRLSGIATGVVNCVGFAGAAVLPVLMGNILDTNKINVFAGYQKAFLILIVVMVASFISSLFATETNAHNVYKE